MTLVNRAARYCSAALGGEVLISPEVHEHVWQLVEAERTTIQTKHEGDFVAYRVKSVKEGASCRVEAAQEVAVERVWNCIRKLPSELGVPDRFT